MERRERRLGEPQREMIRELYSSLRRFAAVVAPAEIEPEDLVQEALYGPCGGVP